MDALEALYTRRSVRRFKPEGVDRSLLERIVEAGKMAATARNVQPWEFVVVTEERTRKEIAALTDHGKFIADCPACIATFCQQTKYYLEDGCAATQNMLVAAWALGLGSCWVAGDKKAYAEDIRRLLQVPAGYKLVSLIALGYPVSSPLPVPKRPLAEVLHWERYGA